MHLFLLDTQKLTDFHINSSASTLNVIWERCKNILRDFLMFQNQDCPMSVWTKTHLVEPQAVGINRWQSITCGQNNHVMCINCINRNTHPFSDPFSRTTRVSRYQKVKPIWILLKQERVSGSGISWAICKSAPRSRQITTPAPHHSVFYRPDALPASQPTPSKHWRQTLSTWAVKANIIIYTEITGYTAALSHCLVTKHSILDIFVIMFKLLCKIRKVFCQYLPNDSELLNKILHAYCMFTSRRND